MVNQYTKLKECQVIKSDKLPDGEWLVIEAEEYQPRLTMGNRTSSYDNDIKVIKLNEDGTYDENNEIIKFSTAFIAFDKRIPEEDIEIIRTMKKTYV